MNGQRQKVFFRFFVRFCFFHSLDPLVKGFRREPQNGLSEKGETRGAILNLNLATRDEPFGAKPDAAQQKNLYSVGLLYFKSFLYYTAP